MFPSLFTPLGGKIASIYDVSLKTRLITSKEPILLSRFLLERVETPVMASETVSGHLSMVKRVPASPLDVQKTLFTVSPLLYSEESISCDMLRFTARPNKELLA